MDEVLAEARAELQKLQRKQRDLYAVGEPGVGGFGRPSDGAPSSGASSGSTAAVASDTISREEFLKFQEAFAKVNELNERIISQNVLLQAELESMARLNADLRSEKAALALKMKRT